MKTDIPDSPDLETILVQRDRIKKRAEVKKQKGFDPYKLLKANNSASFEDFIEMVNRIVTKVLKKYHVTFSPDEGDKIAVTDTDKLDNPHIQFSLIDRVPSNASYTKPKVRETFSHDDGRKGMIYAQIFNYTVQFDILASDYSTANKVMNLFEDALFKYTAYFKENGISEFYFLRQFTDANLDMYRNTVSVRSLQYMVAVERIRTVYDTTIAEINSVDD